RRDAAGDVVIHRIRARREPHDAVRLAIQYRPFLATGWRLRTPEKTRENCRFGIPCAAHLWDNSGTNSEGFFSMDDNRKKALAAALSQIEKQFGKGSVMRLGDAPATWDVEAVSTGSLGLDIALGVGGLPRGRIVEIFGPEASGKTTLTLQVVAEVQRNGGTAAFVDAEHALDPAYAEKLGVNVNDLLVSQPDTG